MVHYRIKPIGKFIEEKDYISGFGMDDSHYMRVCQARNEYNKKNNVDIKKSGVHVVSITLSETLTIREDFSEEWDSREGFNITGKKLNTRYHPLHDIKLIENATGNIYLVDAVYKQHYFGYFISLLVRKEGTESHGMAYWENISSLDPIIIGGIEETKKRFTVCL